MTGHKNIGVHDLQTSDGSEQEPQLQDSEDTSDLEQDDSRQVESNQQRACVLLGSSILQLPMWGFAMSYGVFQEYYSYYDDSYEHPLDHWKLNGNRGIPNIIGTTTNGVMYLSMPFVFALFARRWAHKRQTAAMCGAIITCLSFLLSSFSTQGWHLVATQGVMAPLGCALIYSPTTLSLGEWFNTSNRALAYGVTLSCKNIVGSACPFLFERLLDHFGPQWTLRIWTGVAAGSSIVGILLIPAHPSSVSFSSRSPRARKIPWQFLKHQTFYIYCIAIIFQGSGYGIPQTYLNTYAKEAIYLSETSSTLMLTLFNIPGIVSSSLFGYLSDNKHFTVSATTLSSISAVSSALSVWLLWGLTSKGSMALLLLFSITFGFFAGGYSATWGGVINEMEGEAAEMNEPIDSGMVYGLLNGARGIGYVGGGLAGIPLLEVGTNVIGEIGGFAYGTKYGPLIIFTGLSSAFGGCGLFLKWKIL